MTHLTLAFLKIFYRNRRALFFVILLPAAIYIALSFLNLEQIIQINYPVSYRAFLLPGIIAFALMQVGIYTAPYALIDYRTAGVLKRLSITPLSGVKFLASHILARYILALIQSTVLLAFGFWFSHMPMRPQLLLLPLLILLGNTIFLNIGHLIASSASGYEEAAPYTSATGLLLVFLGDVFFPIKNLPEGLRVLADYLPLKPLSALFRFVFFGANAAHLWQNLLVLGVWFVVLSGVANYVFRKKGYR